MPFWVVVLCIYLLFLCEHVESFLCPHHPTITPVLRYLMSLVGDLCMVLWCKSGCFSISGIRLSWACWGPSAFPLPRCCCWWLLYSPPLCGLFCFSQFAVLTLWRESSMVPRLGREGGLLPGGESRLDSSPAPPGTRLSTSDSLLPQSSQNSCCLAQFSWLGRYPQGKLMTSVSRVRSLKKSQ